MSSPVAAWIDRSAISLSGLCVLHCLIGALTMTMLASVGGVWSHKVHAIGLIVAAPLAVVALWRGVARHGRRAAAALGGGGLSLMAASVTLGHGHAGELATSLAGVTLLGIAHLLNLRWSRG